jgi:UDP-3-O-[3-hydroxymyristoyl] glucosamine N-acyltransferase
MKVKIIREYNSSLKVIVNKYSEFFNLNIIESEMEGLLTFCNNLEYLKMGLCKDNVSVLICKEEDYKQIETDKTIVFSKEPQIDFYRLHNYLANSTDFYGKRWKSKISGKAQVHESAHISDENVIIEDGVVIYPNATILSDVTIKKNSIVGPNSVVGYEGLQIERTKDNQIFSVIHKGGVLIEEEVQIGALTAIDKHIFKDSTYLGSNSIIDNLIHIAHGVKIGKRCVVVASAILCGSSKLGDDVFIGPGACISPGVNVGNSAFITMGSVVSRDVPPGAKVTGNFAIDHDRFIKFIKKINR